MVESFAVDTYDLGHSYEGFVIYSFYQSEYLLTLAATGHDDEHPTLLLRVPSLAVQFGDAALNVIVNLLCYLFMFVRDDGELYALGGRGHRVVKQNHGDEQDDVTGDHLVPIVEDEETRRNDNEVEPHQHAAHREVFVLVDDGGDDIRATSGTIVDEHQRQRSTFDAGTKHSSHERLVAHDLWQRAVGQCYHVLNDAEEKGNAERGIDSLGEKLEAKNLETYGKQDSINDKVAVLCRETCGVVDDGRDTRHAAWREFIGKHEGAEADAVAKASECDEDIVFDFVDDPTYFWAFHSF